MDQRLLDDLLEWLRIPSISTGGGDPADLDGVTSADASTVSWLLHADAVVRLAGGRFVAVIGSGRAGDVLRHTGVESRLDVVGGLHAR